MRLPLPENQCDKQMPYKVLWGITGANYSGIWYESMSVATDYSCVNYKTEGTNIYDWADDYGIIAASINTREKNVQYYAVFTSDWLVRGKCGKYLLPSLDAKMFAAYIDNNNDG